MKNNVKRTERGWAGHFICSNRCRFRRNTLLEYRDIKIVVSSVGLMVSDGSHSFDMIGSERYYETMAFHADRDDTRFYDIDVTREVIFKSPWQIGEVDADDRANDMHEAVVAEIREMMIDERIEK